MNLDSTVIAAIITAFATLFASLLSILLSPPSVLDGIVSLKQKLFSGYTVKITSLTNGQQVKTKEYFIVRGSITGKLPNNTELFLLQKSSHKGEGIYPQGLAAKICTSTGDIWECRNCFGGVGTFDIWIVVAGSGGKCLFDYYFKVNNITPGISIDRNKLPKDVLIADTVSVNVVP